MLRISLVVRKVDMDAKGTFFGEAVQGGGPRSLSIAGIRGGCRILPYLALVVAAGPSSGKTLVDYFLPIPVNKALTTSAWGDAGVIPRDVDNGIEDKTNKSWSYWDGRILKDKSGKYHLYGSRWSQSSGHNGWFGSSCVHTVSDSIRGPYVDKGLCYSDASGQGHNVMVSQLNDGRYFILISETRRPAIVYTSSSLDGPWTKLGTLTFEKNGYNVDVSTGGELHSNTTVWVRTDGSILATARHGIMALSTSGILGPYKVQGTSVYPSISGRENTAVFAEDPVIWYSGNLYHMIYNYPDDRYAYHLTSTDGIHNWTNKGIAFDPRLDFIRYSNGTVNHWYKIERPQVYLEDGHVTHFSFSVIDAEKATDKANDNHNSKVIVVPFDGLQFDKDNGWVPPASIQKGGGTFPARVSISRRSGGFALDYSGYPAGRAEFEAFDLTGRKMASLAATVGTESGSLAWGRLDLLPKGIYTIAVRVGGAVQEGIRFAKF
jgi:hypothetical protein